MGTFLASSRIWLRMSHGLKEIKSVSSSDHLNLQPIELQMGIASLIQGNWIANEDFRFFTLSLLQLLLYTLSRQDALSKPGGRERSAVFLHGSQYVSDQRRKHSKYVTRTGQVRSHFSGCRGRWVQISLSANII